VPISCRRPPDRRDAYQAALRLAGSGPDVAPASAPISSAFHVGARVAAAIAPAGRGERAPEALVVAGVGAATDGLQASCIEHGSLGPGPAYLEDLACKVHRELEEK
jgi:hypothetical protein